MVVGRHTPLLHGLRKTEKERGGDAGPRIFSRRRQRPAASGPATAPRAMTESTVSLVLPLALYLEQTGKAPARNHRGVTPSRSDTGWGEPLSLRQGALTAAPAGAPRHPPRVAHPLRVPAPGPLRPRRPAKLTVGARGGRAVGAAGADSSAAGSAPLRAPGGRARGGGESARPCPPPRSQSVPRHSPAAASRGRSACSAPCSSPWWQPESRRRCCASSLPH